MDECKRCFWLEVHDKWRRPKGIFPSLPNGIDSILKKRTDAFRARLELPPELSGALGDAFKPFGDAKTLDAWRDRYRGLRWTDSAGNILAGAIDDVVENDGKLVLLDYKTRGYPLKDESHNDYKGQLDIYAFLLDKIGRRVADFAYIIFYIPKDLRADGAFLFDAMPLRVTLDLSYAQKLFDSAIGILNGSEPADRCDWCRYVPAQ